RAGWSSAGAGRGASGSGSRRCWPAPPRRAPRRGRRSSGRARRGTHARAHLAGGGPACTGGRGGGRTWGGPQSGGGGTPRPRLASTRSSADVLVPDPPVDRRRARWGFFVAFDRAAWAGPVLSASVSDPRITPQENEGPGSREEPRPDMLPEPGFRGRLRR